MRERLYVHLPAQLLATRLPFLLNRKLQPEIACQDVNIGKLDLGLMRDCAEQLAVAGLKTCLHAPFQGFEPGSSRSRSRKKAQLLCEHSLQLAAVLNAKRVVFHPGIPFGSNAKQQTLWLKNSLAFWPEVVAQAQQLSTMICIENIFEADPAPLLELLEGVASAAFAHCFDIGHWNMFHNAGLTEWLERTAPHLCHLHLHDNRGRHDEHLPLGAGEIDFSALFSWLQGSGRQPTMTLEAHNPSDLDLSLQAFSRLTTPDN